jgi:hypothetical protein
LYESVKLSACGRGMQVALKFFLMLVLLIAIGKNIEPDMKCR